MRMAARGAGTHPGRRETDQTRARVARVVL